MNAPVLYVIAGANGTGKTTAIFDLVPPGVPVVNSDEIAKQIKISGTATFNSQELGNREALHLTEKYLNERQTFGVETNLADVETWKFLIAVKKTGYLLHLIFLCTDDLNLLNSRIKERTLRGEHFIRHDIVAERYLNGLQLLKHYLNSPNKIQFIDSSRRNVLIAEMQNNKIELLTEKLPAWFANHIAITFESTGQEQKVTAKDANSIEAVRLQYEKLKNKGGLT